MRVSGLPKSHRLMEVLESHGQRLVQAIMSIVRHLPVLEIIRQRVVK